MVFNRFERFTFFKPPAMPVVYDSYAALCKILLSLPPLFGLICLRSYKLKLRQREGSMSIKSFERDWAKKRPQPLNSPLCVSKAG